MGLYNISAIHELYAFENGDTLTPAMGVSIESGYALAQYFDPATKKVVNTDFKLHPATLYPQPYSSSRGSIVVPESVGQQWYYNNINEASAILDDNGNVKAKFAGTFETTKINSNGMTFPALKIKDNLATETDFTSKMIYYSSTWNGKAFTCSQQIPIQAAAGNSYAILLSFLGPGNVEGDSVLSDKGDFVKVTAYLQQSGETVSGDVSYSFERFNGSNWIALASEDGLYTVTGNSIRIEEPAVEGIETFRAVARFKGEVYYMPFQISDIQDSYFIVDGCSIDGEAVMSGTDVTFAPEVYIRKSGQKDTDTWTFAYQVLRRSDNALVRDGSGSRWTIDYATIKDNGGVRVRIQANKA